jgi:hypothetical protein
VISKTGRTHFALLAGLMLAGNVISAHGDSIGITNGPAPATPPPDLAATAYMKDVQAEQAWSNFVKESFSPKKISITCQAYKPQEYPACFFRYATDITQKKRLTTPGVTYLLAIGIMVDTQSYDDEVKNPAFKGDKDPLELKKSLDVIDVSLTLLERDQTWRKTDQFLPAGPSADRLQAKAKAGDAQFQNQMIKKIAELFKKSSESSCREIFTCPDLDHRYQVLNKTFARIKADVPKN